MTRTSHCGLMVGSTVTVSPRPWARAVPPRMKKATSEPRRAAKEMRSTSVRLSLKRALAALRAVAASLLPPPRPAAVGIRLMMRRSTPAGAMRSARDSSARYARLAGPSGAAPDGVQLTVIPSGAAERMRVSARLMVCMTELIS